MLGIVERSRRLPGNTDRQELRVSLGEGDSDEGDEQSLGGADHAQDAGGFNRELRLAERRR